MLDGRKERKRISVSEQSQEKLADILLNFCFIFRGTLEDYIAIREHAKTHTDAKLIYQTKSFDKIKIAKEGDNK